jgi:hypothetical protein
LIAKTNLIANPDFANPTPYQNLTLLEKARSVGGYPESKFGAASRTQLSVELVQIVAGLGGIVAALAAPFVLGGALLMTVFSAAEAAASEVVAQTTIESSQSVLHLVTFYGAAVTLLGATLFLGGAALGVVIEGQRDRRG